jgi:hypothetical protein
MSSDDRTGDSAGRGSPAADQHPVPSRRSVLRGAAGAAGAGLAASTLMGAVASPAMASAAKAARANAPAARTGQAEEGGAASAEPVVVHVRDAHSGEMDVFSGTSHVRLRDPAVAAKLVRAIR